MVKDFLNKNVDSSIKIIINTNADDTTTPFTFERLLTELKDYKDRVVLKISLDGIRKEVIEKSIEFKEFFKEKLPNYNFEEIKAEIDFLAKYPKIDHSESIVKNIEMALKNDYEIGLNFVITDSNKRYLRTTLFYSYYLFNKYQNLYFKILDLNWYHDIGNRHDEPNSYQFWNDEYISPLKYYYEEDLQNIFGIPQNTLNLNSGIPMIEVDKVFPIKIKDSSLGTHYHKGSCFSCFFYTKNLCQEGIYQPWITPEGTLKMCYHRPDIIKSMFGNNDVMAHPEIFDRFKNLLGALEYVQIKRVNP